MLPNIITKEITLADGRKITLETGKLARQADGAVVVTMGQTMLLATVVSQKDAKDEVDFLPLSVDFQERFAAAGKVPGGFLKREGRLSTYEILTSRLVDRAMRPLFPDDYHADTQINVFMISSDPEVPADALAALAASAAVSVSDIPFNGPIAEVRVARINGEFVINPSVEALEEADIEIMLGATLDSVLMVEGEMKEVSEEDMVEAIRFGHEAIKVLCQAQKEFEAEAGATEKREYEHETHDEELKQRMHDELYDKAYAVAQQQMANKSKRSEAFKAIKDEFVESLPEDDETDMFLISQYYGKIKKKACRDLALKERKRIDGREFNEIRPIWGEVGYLPATHGSALFTRGETQSISTLTLGTKLDELFIDNATFKGTQKFMLHYNFPGFSTGEVKPNRGASRREIGHGNLAYRALKGMLPKDEENPYTIRIVSDILESNGSSSMATVCAGTMALMDGGITIKAPVSGIAMGLISDESDPNNYAVLSDILGDEDHLGDMDFKVTGTRDGITACQMDIKMEGLSYEILIKALYQAKEGRMHILDKIQEIIPETASDLKPHAPRSTTVVIEKDQIGAVIGPGGKIVQEIQKVSGATVVIEEKEENGHVNIFANDRESMDAAYEMVKRIVAVPVVGEIYEGKVKSIMPFGAFIEFLPGKEGLLHISEIKWERIEKMEGVLEVGEEVTIKLIDVDKRNGKFRLSRKVLLPKPAKKQN
ncbi:MAG TPA: polyribonucleotide nucleotidyltransferase [Microscillaceae bacterium]|nr:polyribonucleotide nucleotidyltransferase [Microscillaceae bacterium]